MKGVKLYPPGVIGRYGGSFLLATMLLAFGFGQAPAARAATVNVAIDAGDPAFAPPPAFDQRGPGFPRVVNGRIDIGAYEK